MLQWICGNLRRERNDAMRQIECSHVSPPRDASVSPVLVVQTPERGVVVCSYGY